MKAWAVQPGSVTFTREGLSPSRIGSGCCNLGPMAFDSFIPMVVEFFNSAFGKVLQFLYVLLFPANSPAAQLIEEVQ